MRKKVLFTLLFVVAIAASFGVGYLVFHRGQDPTLLVLYGNVDVRQVDIGFRVAGQVEKLFFEEGDKVPKGALMAVLDKTPYDNQLAEMVANAESIAVNLNNAEVLLERREELIAIGGVSQEDLDNARANRDELRANLVQAEAAVVVAFDNLRYTQAFCPNDGVILTRIREPGTVVNPAQPVYTVSLSSPVWVRAYVNEPDLGRIYFGMEGLVYTDTMKGKVYKGKIGFISPVAEFTPKTVETTKLRTDLVYRLRLYVDNPDDLLKQGMPVTVKLHTAGRK